MHESQIGQDIITLTISEAVDRLPRRNLTISLTPLIGREKDVALGRSLLQSQEVRLLTLTGTGGVGKTRLGLQVATELQDDFANGVLFISLASIHDPKQVIAILAHALELRGSNDDVLFEHIQAFLSSKSMLLLLDNFEHVFSAAPMLTTLLSVCPLVKILVTSRTTLHMQGEHELPVLPLSLPDFNQTSTHEDVEQFPAVKLFVQRAKAVKFDFQLSPENANIVARICARLDGIPLALELAAARIKLLPPEALLARLEHPLALLTSGGQDSPPRQRSLRDTITWSYDLLSEDEQTIFRRMAIFEQGCQLEAIEAVCAAFNPLQLTILDGVAQLIDKSLLLQQSEQDEPRLLILETIREFALEKLAASEEHEQVQEAHAAYYLALAERAEPELYRHQQRFWLARLEQEHQNIRIALTFFRRRNERENLAHFVGTLGWFWYMHGFLNEGREWVDALFTAGIEDLPRRIRGKVISASGVFAGFLGQGELAFARCEESLPLCKEFGDLRSLSASVYMLVHSFLALGELAAAQALGKETLAFVQSAGDIWAVGALHCMLGSIALYEGDYERAWHLHEHGIAIFEDVGDLCMNGLIRMMLADVAVAQGNMRQAQKLIERGREMFQQVGATWSLSSYFTMWGQIALSIGQYRRAHFLLQEALSYLQRMGDQQGMLNTYTLLIQEATQEHDYSTVRTLAEQHLEIAHALNDRQAMLLCMEELATLLSKQGQVLWAAYIWGALDRVDQTAHIDLSARDRREPFISTLRNRLGDRLFAQAWSEGQNMTLEQAVALPIDSVDSHSMPSATSTVDATQAHSSLELTKRELDVLGHLAQGRTNAQIAEQLTISTATVNSYLRTIYGKLGVTSRTGAIRF
ncbi:MAG: AAA family ATPase, partial [Ktedonobacteraceae bacterium]|nr:AAA family ATPase [Ktedonobacteraceae bacterium]